MNRLYRLVAAGLLLVSTFAIVRGLGWSQSNDELVARAVGRGLPPTIGLGFAALVATLAVGSVFGYVRARARTSVLREILAVPELLCRSLPIISFALLLQLADIFTLRLPLAGMADAAGFDLRDRLVHLIAPVLCLAVPFGAWSSLIFAGFFAAPEAGRRGTTRELRRAAVTTAVLISPALLSACLIVEPLFAWPGLGRIFNRSLSAFDFPAAAGVLVVYSAALALLALAAGFLPDHTPAQRSASQQRTDPRDMRLSATAIVALILLAAAVLGAVAANLIAPIGPDYIDQAHWSGYPLAPGVAGHALGTDENARDLLARLLFALRTSLGIAAMATAVAASIGFVVAKAAPRFGDRRATSITGIRPFAAFPFIMVAVALIVAKAHTTAALSPLTIALILGAVSWPAIVPAFRASASELLGSVVSIMGCAVLLEVTLSSLGFGVQPPTPSLGNLLLNMQSNLSVAPWIPIVSMTAIMTVVSALYALSDELQLPRFRR